MPVMRRSEQPHVYFAGGTLVLEDADLFGGTDRPGARAVVRLPIKALTPETQGTAQDAAE